MSAALNVLVGIWIAFSPTVLGYGEGDPRVNELICGGLVAAFALLRSTRSARTPLLSWWTLAIGVWLVLAGFFLGGSGVASVNQAVSGGLVMLLAATSAVTARG